MAEIVQCDACKKEIDADEFVNKITLSRRKAEVGLPENPSDETDVCNTCLPKTRLHITELGWPEVKE